MTPDELRALAGEATQEGLERIPALHQLKKMAPQLALLCAEQHEILAAIVKAWNEGQAWGQTTPGKPVRPVVARFEALEKPQ